eukprot:jgi/Psemu1/32517/gm1.32517_g
MVESKIGEKSGIDINRRRRQSKEEPMDYRGTILGGAEITEKTVGMFPGEIIVLSGETEKKEPVLSAAERTFFGETIEGG